MGTTPNYAIPYPELTDPPDGAGQMKALAQKVDTQLKTNDTAVRQVLSDTTPKVKIGLGVSVPISGASNAQLAVTFPLPAFPAPPYVDVGCNNGGGATAQSIGARNLGTATTTGFTIFVFNVNNTTITFTPVVSWAAILPGTTFPTMMQVELADHHTIDVTCRTDGCPNQGEAIPMQIPDNPESANWAGVTCGACSQMIM